MTTLAVTQFAFLPRFHLLSHRLEVALHSINAYRNAIDQRERFRVFGEDGREIPSEGHVRAHENPIPARSSPDACSCRSGCATAGKAAPLASLSSDSLVRRQGGSGYSFRRNRIRKTSLPHGCKPF